VAASVDSKAGKAWAFLTKGMVNNNFPEFGGQALPDKNMFRQSLTSKLL